MTSLSRRILVSLAAPLSGAFASRSTASPVRADVIVVGAGIAGLAAANQVTQAGRTVLVLEAGSRTGGRVHISRLWLDAPVDLGAAWIHGTRGNPLTSLAERFGAARIPTRSGSEIMMGPGGTPPPPNLDADLDFAETPIEAAREAVDDLDNDVSLSDAVTRALRRRPLTPTRRAAALGRG